MKTIKNIIVLFFAFTLIIACNEEEKKKGRFSFDKIKTDLNLSAEQTEKFNAVIAKYTKIREEGFAAAKEGGKMDRSVMMKKMQTILKSQNEEIVAFLTPAQLSTYQAFTEKMARRGKSGYSDKDVLKITTELVLDSSQVKMLNAVNKAFEKSYSNAHDFYHGNADLAKEYWDKYDQERKNTLQKIFTEEQHVKYLEIAKELAFKGEHK